jgi:hypothetical protein
MLTVSPRRALQLGRELREGDMAGSAGRRNPAEVTGAAAGAGPVGQMARSGRRPWWRRVLAESRAQAPSRIGR